MNVHRKKYRTIASHPFSLSKSTIAVLINAFERFPLFFFLFSFHVQEDRVGTRSRLGARGRGKYQKKKEKKLEDDSRQFPGKRSGVKKRSTIENGEIVRAPDLSLCQNQQHIPTEHIPILRGSEIVKCFVRIHKL